MIQHHINKQITLDFYKNVIGLCDLQYAEQAVTDHYIQHNPHVKTGKEGFLEAISFLKQIPRTENSEKPFLRIISDGVFVAVHYQVTFAGQEKIVLDLFRLENGLIAEHWDAIQDLSEASLIENFSEIKDLNLTSANKDVIERFTKDRCEVKNEEIVSSYISSELTGLHQQKQTKDINLLPCHTTVSELRTHRIIGEGNFVVVQSSALIDSQQSVIYEVFRLENSLIAEHWLISQTVPENMAHNNGMI